MLEIVLVFESFFSICVIVLLFFLQYLLARAVRTVK